MSTPISQHSSNNTFFPSSAATTPDHASANAMLAARKQQLAHLQTLQRQQQQVLQQMGTRGANPPASPLAGYAADVRDDRFSAGGLRSHPGSPMGGSQAGGSVVSFNNSSFNNQRAASPRRPAFECDYDTNPTGLYLSVQRKDWEGAVERAASCPHEASTWVSRKESDGKLRWRLLPLHAAIIFRAPERTVSALLFAFAQGAACKDDQGMLPLHLAFRNGCDEEVVNLLLMAYPQSVDVQDRKGRTPMVLAQQSTHANRDVYIRALERGPAYYAVANAAKDGIANVPAMPSSHPVSLPTLANESHTHHVHVASSMAPASISSGRNTSDLEAELAKTQETSQVLVDHVNSLEAQLASRSDTERFLATKIANLDSQLKETNAKLEEAHGDIEAKKAELVGKDELAELQVTKVEEEINLLKAALEDKKSAELKSYKLTNKERFDLEERVETSERDCAAAQANAAVLEAQLKKKIETEQSLASQVSMLASQLASSASSSSEATTAYQRKCELLSVENKKLQAHIEDLEGKLGTVATALDAMAAEQERIVEAATKHESTMAACATANSAIISDTTRQETLLEDAAKEREQIVSILMRQAEDAERTMADREKVLEAVKTQEESMATAAQERDAVVDSVNKQREYMDFMMNSELKFLKRTASEEECELVNEGKLEEMERKKDEFLAEAKDDAVKDEAEEADAIVGDDEPAIVASVSEDDDDESDDEEDDAALEEAANAVKAAMRAAEDAVDNGDIENDESVDAEEEEAAASPSAEYESAQEEAAVDDAISAASSQDSSP
ncbi:hypothetical protein ACHAXR_007548 [Thalassiosira sp. AJA248-18]